MLTWNVAGLIPNRSNSFGLEVFFKKEVPEDAAFVVLNLQEVIEFKKNKNTVTELGKQLHSKVKDGDYKETKAVKYTPNSSLKVGKTL